jgi:hypothetical protein
MVNITLSIPAELKNTMNEFPEINWSGLVRVTIESKAKQLRWKQEMLKKIKEEDKSGFTNWTIEMGRKVNDSIVDKLKDKKL